MYNRLHTIPACDRQTNRRTDGHTSCHGIVRAMYTRRVVKMSSISRRGKMADISQIGLFSNLVAKSWIKTIQ